MADGKRRLSSRFSAKYFQSLSVAGSPSSASRLFASRSLVRIPLQRIRCGSWDVKTEEKWLEYQPTSKTLRFGFHDRKDEDHEPCASFECRDVSAADLRVGTKFGCFDNMVGTLTVECGSLISVDTFHQNRNNFSVYVAELTFHVNYTGQVRDVIRALRYSMLEDTAPFNENNNEITMEGNKNAKKIREGLPEWVHWIPRKLYTPGFRQFIETSILIYTVLSILWALWQLYRHVDFMRAYVQPILDLLRYHIRLMDKMMHVLNDVLEKFTERWFSYLKPGYVLLTSLASPLLSLVAPIWVSISSAVDIFKFTFGPIFQSMHSLFYFLYVFFIKTPCSALYPLYHLAVKLLSIVVDLAVYRMFPAQFAALRNFGIAVKGLVERSVNLDPLRSHFLLMRTTVINSSKALGLGLVAMYRRAEYLIWQPENVDEVDVEEDEVDVEEDEVDVEEDKVEFADGDSQ